MSLQPQIGIITQARMTSTRLPGKIFKKINEKTLLQYHIERLQKTGFDIAIATTTNNTDNCVCEYAHSKNIKFYRGSENNVLSRFYETATQFKYDIIVRVTSDCPLIDPHLLRNGIEKYLKLNNPNLYLSNGLERTFARGFDFEIFSYQLLSEAFEKASTEEDLEHVTPFIWKNKSGKIDFYHFKQAEDNSKFRITVDTVDDFELIKQLIEKYNADKLPYNEIEKILSNDPELIALNSHIKQKKI
ncbi:MAG: cytidylyltransferase domain-containing protein [Bacteroidota bacterium]